MDRRSMLRLAATAALLPAAAARAATRFAPPAGPMRYVRRLERDLGGGASFVVVRSFAIRFVPFGRGFRIEGEQQGVEVEAPERLAEFARLERERTEASLFPLTLDAAGLITGGEARQPATQLDEAVRAVLAQFAARPRDAAELEQMQQYLAAVHQGAGRVLTELPRDLFAPGAGPRSERRDVALPGGERGLVTVTFSAEADPATGLMRRAERTVVTELAGDSRRTAELWTLAPA